VSPCAHHDDAGSYVLRALPDDEHERFEAHLATCEACRREVADLQMAAATWLMQMELFARALKAERGGRLRSLDAAQFLSAPKRALAAIDALFGFELGAEAIDAVVAGPVFRHNSKIERPKLASVSPVLRNRMCISLLVPSATYRYFCAVSSEKPMSQTDPTKRVRGSRMISDTNAPSFWNTW